MDGAAVPPLIRVTRGRASEEDVAALAAILLLVRSRQQPAGAAAAGRPAAVRWPAGLSGWNHHDRYHAPGAWTSQGMFR